MRQHDAIIKPVRWGKDHWSTLLYVETRVVYHSGTICAPQMRTNEGNKYPTRLSDKKTLDNHNDWDCLEDLEQAGLIIHGGTGINPVYTLSDFGWLVAGRCRRWKSEGKGIMNFKLVPLIVVNETG